MNPYPHPYLNHRPATGGTTVDPALQHESNTHLLQTLQNRVTSLGRAAASNASRLVVGFIIIAAVSVLALASFSMSTFSIASDINYYYPKTSSLADAIFGDDAPLLIAPPYNASLQCPTISGRADLCTYFSYVNETIDVFTLFMINGTRPNVTLASLPYTNSAPIMAGVSNGQQAIDALVVAVTNASVVGAANTADIASIEASVGSTYYVERAAVGGADTPTCGRQPLFPCATPAYALTHVAAIASPNVSLVLQLGAGLFVAPALTLPCNLAVRGAGTSTTTLVAAGLSIGSGSACANVLADLSIQLTAATNLTLTSLALRNVSFIGAPIYPLYISGPPSPLGAVIIDNVDLTGISIFSITDAQVYARSLLHGTIVTIAYTVLGGLAELYNFQVGITSFAFSTAASGVTSTLLGYGWSNPSSGAWTIATASGSTTIFRGDDGVVGLVNANNTYYGPLSSGGGTLNVQRESGAFGQAYVASAPSTWVASGVPTQTNDALDKLSSRTFAVENVAGRDITTLVNLAPSSGSDCNAFFPFNVNLFSATKHVSGIDYFTQQSSIWLVYTGSSTAVFRITLTVDAVISYGASGVSDGFGFCRHNQFDGSFDCVGTAPNTPIAIAPAGSAGKTIGSTFTLYETLTPGQVFTLFTYVGISTMTACAMQPQAVQLEFLFFP